MRRAASLDFTDLILLCKKFIFSKEGFCYPYKRCTKLCNFCGISKISRQHCLTCIGCKLKIRFSEYSKFDSSTECFTSLTLSLSLFPTLPFPFFPPSSYISLLRFSLTWCIIQYIWTHIERTSWVIGIMCMCLTAQPPHSQCVCGCVYMGVCLRVCEYVIYMAVYAVSLWRSLGCQMEKFCSLAC